MKMLKNLPEEEYLALIYKLKEQKIEKWREQDRDEEGILNVSNSTKVKIILINIYF